jgi:hypothetical protein
MAHMSLKTVRRVPAAATLAPAPMTTHPDRRADGQGQFRWPDFDVYGNVNGVNTAIFSSSGVWVGIAFDIPADIVKAGVVQFKEPAT